MIFNKAKYFIKNFIFHILYYLIHRNFLFGFFFYKFIKKFKLTIKKKKIVFDIPKLKNMSHYSGFFFKTYEINDLFLLKKWLTTHDKTFIIGGGIGVTSVCSYLMSSNKIIVSEINQKILSILRHNLDYNSVEYELIKQNISFNKEKSKNFFFSKNFLETSSTKIEGAVNNEKVENISIDIILKSFKSDFNTLVLDCEGYEYDIITNINLLPNVKKIFVELHPKILGEDKMNLLVKTLDKNSYILKDSFLGSYYYEKLI